MNKRQSVISPVGPAGAPSKLDQHRRLVGDPPVHSLPFLQLVGAQLIVWVNRRAVGSVHQDPWREKPIHRNFVQVLSPFREVRRRVQVRSAMFRGGYPVGLNPAGK